jgi:anti-sigma factor RsiW
MDCPREPEVLSSFVDGETPASQQRAVARHVLDCEKCAAETGRLLAVRSYLDVEPEEQASLSQEFFARLHQALSLSDMLTVAHHARPQRAPLVVSPRVAWATSAALALLLLAVALSWHPAPPGLLPASLAQAHESTVGPNPQAAWLKELASARPASNNNMSLAAVPASFGSGASLEPATLGSGPNISRNGLWGAAPASAPAPLPPSDAPALDHQVYSGAGLIVSRFTLADKALDVHTWQRVRRASGDYFTTQQGATTLLAQREGDGQWRLLASDASVEQLLAFAELYAAELSR